jgi:glycosyltransferase involved in cell wall biosynthesis
VLIVQTIVPHYALPLFAQLAHSRALRLTVACGDARPADSLQNVPDFGEVRREILRNVYLLPRLGIRWQAGLFRTIRLGSYDTVIAEFDLRVVSSILACLLKRRKGVRFIWWGHGIGPRRRWLSRVLRVWLCQRADAVIFYDQTNADRFVSWGVPRDRAFVAWNSIDTEQIAPLVRKWQAEERRDVIYIGRLVPEKKARLLIDGFAEALRRSQSSRVERLTLIGDGPERRELEERAAHLGITGRVQFTGALYREADIAPFFNRGLVCVSPGYIGLSAIHSLAYGVPLLVADDEPHSPEISALEPDRNGVLFRAGSASALADALLLLLGDEARLKRMSAAARETVEGRFSMSAMAASFEQAVAFVHRGQ